MTPDEKTLSDAMHRTLLRRTMTPGTPTPVRIVLGDNVYATFYGGHMILTVERDNSGPYQIIELTPEVFKDLQRFAEECGWQCD